MHPASLGISLDRMKRQLKKVVFKTSHKKEKVFAFIDAQNIAKGIENSGWKIDWSAFRQWLAKKHNVSQAYMYIGYMAQNRDLYLQLNNNGFNIDLKQTVKSMRNSSGPYETNDVKGNVDVDLTIGVWREYAHYDKAIIISGDGDFASLIQYLIDNKKLKNIIVPEFYSSLFKKFGNHVIELNSYRGELNYVRNQRSNQKSKNSKVPSSRTSHYVKTKSAKNVNLDVYSQPKARQDMKQRVSLLNKAGDGK